MLVVGESYLPTQVEAVTNLTLTISQAVFSGNVGLGTWLLRLNRIACCQRVRRSIFVV